MIYFPKVVELERECPEAAESPYCDPYSNHL